jgi:hypothetical protein
MEDRQVRVGKTCAFVGTGGGVAAAILQSQLPIGNHVLAMVIIAIVAVATVHYGLGQWAKGKGVPQLSGWGAHFPLLSIVALALSKSNRR